MAEEKTVLIVEDDREIAEIVSMNLQDLGLRSERAADGLEGLRKALDGDHLLIILDLMLPRMDGLTICRKIRADKPTVPILMLTAKSDEIDRVLGLEIGADDYLTKPFSIRELIARVKALLRRAEMTGAEVRMNRGRIEFGGFSLDFDKRKVTLEERPVELTVKEFDLLALFVREPGRTFSRTDLLSLIWGYQYEGYEHTVNSHINRLRSKIESDPGHPKYLKTVWGVGYRFAEIGELSP